MGNGRQGVTAQGDSSSQKCDHLLDRIQDLADVGVGEGRRQGGLDVASGEKPVAGGFCLGLGEFADILKWAGILGLASWAPASQLYE